MPSKWQRQNGKAKEKAEYMLIDFDPYWTTWILLMQGIVGNNLFLTLILFEND
jgi:hypothetical protein